MSGFKRGNTIFQSKPFAFIIVKGKRPDVCEWCWDSTRPGDGAEPKDVPAFSCSGCGLVNYCSRICLEDGKSEHKEECLVLQRSAKEIENISDQIRLILRIWIKLEKSNGHDIVETCSGVSRKWSDLMDHQEDLEKDSLSNITAMHEQLANCVKSSDLPTLGEFISIYGRILTNSFSLRTDRFHLPEPFGTGVYLVPSVLDHSCLPNATVVFRGRELSVLATKTISSGPVHQTVRISYVNTLEDTNRRQTENRTIWYFTCQCKLCQDESLDAEKRSVICGGCERPRPVSTSTWAPLAPCRYCSYQNKREDAKLLKRYKELYRLLEGKEAKALQDKLGMSQDELCEWVVGEMEDVFSARDILFLNTVHFVHTVCIERERWEAAVYYGEKILPTMKFYYGETAGIVAGLLLRMGIACGEMEDDDSAKQFFDEADDIYRVIPGEKHPFYAEDLQKILQKYRAN